jgi:hypothetical protein
VPPDAVREIVAVEVVTTLPAASSTLMIGCTVNTEPEAPAVGDLVKTSWVARPALDGLKVALVAVARPLEVALKV